MKPFQYVMNFSNLINLVIGITLVVLTIQMAISLNKSFKNQKSPLQEVTRFFLYGLIAVSLIPILNIASVVAETMTPAATNLIKFVAKTISDAVTVK